MRDTLALWHQGSTLYGRHIGPVVIVATGFGLLLGSMRRASRPLLAWVLVAAATDLFTQPSAPPRGLGLLLPPLALAAAVGLQSPARWLGGLVLSLAAVVSAVIVSMKPAAPIEMEGLLFLLPCVLVAAYGAWIVIAEGPLRRREPSDVRA